MLLPVFFLVGLPVGCACGVAAVVETRRRGRPGWLIPLLLGTGGALILHGRGESEAAGLMPLLVGHLGAVAGCTFVARQLVKGQRPTP